MSLPYLVKFYYQLPNTGRPQTKSMLPTTRKLGPKLAQYFWREPKVEPGFRPKSKPKINIVAELRPHSFNNKLISISVD